MAISGILLTPLAVPILPVSGFVTYAKTLGLWNLIKMEKGEGDRLPLHFVYRLGWEGLVDTVHAAYEALPPNERSRCAILASWYGIAGAIDHYGPQLGLPNAICPRNSYWMWGPRSYTGDEVIAVGYDAPFLRKFFDSVERVRFFENPYAYDAEICLCRKPRAPVGQMWLRLKRFI